MKFLKKKKGFTLIELLVVVAIIGVLASITLSSLREARNKALDAKIKSSMNSIKTNAELYVLGNNVFYGGYTSNFTFICDSESLCQFFNSFVKEGDNNTSYDKYKQATDAYEKDSWENSGVHRIYFGQNGASYSAVVRLRGGGYWCVDSNGFSGEIPSFPPNSFTIASCRN